MIAKQICDVIRDLSHCRDPVLPVPFPKGNHRKRFLVHLQKKDILCPHKHTYGCVVPSFCTWWQPTIDTELHLFCF